MQDEVRIRKHIILSSNLFKLFRAFHLLNEFIK